jgi:hypothetical protein
MERTPHPPYSSDLAPENLFLSDYINKILNGYSFHSVENLLSEIYIILASIEKAVWPYFLLCGCQSRRNAAISIITTSDNLNNNNHNDNHYNNNDNNNNNHNDNHHNNNNNHNNNDNSNSNSNNNNNNAFDLSFYC